MTSPTDPSRTSGSSPLTLVGSGVELCCRFVDALPVTGASISVFDSGGRQSTIGATDVVASQLDELQFALGEGPRFVALRSGQPVLVSDLKETTALAWPVFGAAASELGAKALFAFPLVMGAVTMGVVDLYRSTAGLLTESAVHTAQSLAGSVAVPAAKEAVRAATDENPPDAVEVSEMRREVHQATGMILVQLNTTATEAFLRLRAYAFATGLSVQRVAHDVVSRTIDLSEHDNREA